MLVSENVVKIEIADRRDLGFYVAIICAVVPSQFGWVVGLL
jgi:hypothetical protein